MKTAFVTGASKGMGKETALMMARNGYCVAINYRKSKDDASHTLELLGKINENCMVLHGDMTDETDVKRAFSAIMDRYGRIDVLVNNVGDFLYVPLFRTSKKELMQVVENNVASVFLCSKTAIPFMARQKHGRIINFGSVGCDELLAPDNTTPYYVGKTGVYLLTKALSRNSPEGVTVNMVSPGVLPTSVVKSPDASLTNMDDVCDAIMDLIEGSETGKNVTIASWKPEG